MTLQSVFEQYKHFDSLLSDREWLTGPDEEGHRDTRMVILCDCWQAMKEELENPSKEDLVKFAKWCNSLQPQAVEIMRREGFKFDNLDDPWQKLAFTFYSDLCEINSNVKQLFEEDSDD